MWFTLELAHKAQHLALTLSQELILALTPTKLVLKSKDVFTKHLVGFELFSDVYGVPHDSSSLKMPRVRLYIG